MELCPCLNPQAHSIPVLLNAPTASLFIVVRDASAGAYIHSTVQGINTRLRCASRFTGIQHTAGGPYSGSCVVVAVAAAVRYRRRMACLIRERPRSGDGNRSTNWIRPDSMT